MIIIGQTDKNSYEDIAEYCYSAKKQEIADNDYSLVPSKCIEFVNQDEKTDFDSHMHVLQNELKSIFEEEETSRDRIKNLFSELGFPLDWLDPYE